MPFAIVASIVVSVLRLVVLGLLADDDGLSEDGRRKKVVYGTRRERPDVVAGIRGMTISHGGSLGHDDPDRTRRCNCRRFERQN